MDFDDSRVDDPPTPWEIRLAALSPNSGGLSASRLLFEAGMTAGRRRARTHRLAWGTASLLPLFISTCLYLQERSRTQHLGTALAAQERRLDALERRSDALATTLADPSFTPTRGGYFRLRAQWLSGASDGVSEVENQDRNSLKTDDRDDPSSSIRVGTRSLEL